MLIRVFNLGRELCLEAGVLIIQVLPRDWPADVIRVTEWSSFTLTVLPGLF